MIVCKHYFKQMRNAQNEMQESIKNSIPYKGLRIRRSPTALFYVVFRLSKRTSKWRVIGSAATIYGAMILAERSK